MEKKTVRKPKEEKSVKPTFLEAIEKVVELSRESKLDGNFLRKAKRYLTVLADAYGITPMQAALFSICVEYGPRRIDYSDLSKHLGVGNVRVLSYATDIDALVRRRLLRYRNVRDEESFDIPVNVIKCLKHNKVFELPPTENLDCAGLFNVLKLWFNDLDDVAVSLDDFTNELKMLFKENPQVAFVKKVNELKLHDYEWLLLLLFCNQLVNEDEEELSFNDMEIVFDSDDPFLFSIIKTRMRNGDLSLMQMNLVEHSSANGMVDTKYYKLTEDAKRNLLSEMHIQVFDEHVADVMKVTSLKEKKMYYAEETARQVEELRGLFTEEQYQSIRQRLQDKSLRCGFTCLFYGGPGTGKTETVYQLARQTGRDIFVVDVPQIKSKWVGDSEKNVKALFDRYRNLQKNSKLAPILLFNEADAIIGIRKTGAENAVDKMENTVQNIILQEMETLEGIMVATTNLQCNFDSAFERRFLYKIQFPKPQSAVRMAIWKEMLPELSDEDLKVVAEKYDFSGGQIENVTRRYNIEQILHGDASAGLQHILSLCDSERMDRKETRRVGF